MTPVPPFSPINTSQVLVWAWAKARDSSTWCNNYSGGATPHEISEPTAHSEGIVLFQLLLHSYHSHNAVKTQLTWLLYFSCEVAISVAHWGHWLCIPVWNAAKGIISLKHFCLFLTIYSTYAYYTCVFF